MEIKIVKAKRAEKTVLRQLLAYYYYDFSEYLHTDVNDHGMFEYHYLDLYWVESGRDPYFVKMNGKYAGFVLISKHFCVLEDPLGNSIAEFFIMRKYRGKGLGRKVALEIFDRYPGSWEVSILMVNEKALRFWNKLVIEYTNGQFERVQLDEKDLRREVLMFNNGDQAKGK